MFDNVQISREDPYATVTVKIEGEAPFKIEGLSSRITEQSLALILPAMIDRQRAKRERKELRKIELATAKEKRVQREIILSEVDLIGKTDKQEATQHEND